MGKGYTTVRTAAAVLAVLLVLGACAGTGEKKRASARNRPPRVKILCPVSGEPLTVPRQALSSEYEGKKYYFCCTQCKEEFDRNPEKFVGK